MTKLFRIRDYVLLVAGLSGSLFEEMRLMGGLIPNLMAARYGFVPPNYKRSSYLSTVSRMLSTGNIERLIDKKGRVFFQLTSSGEKAFKRRFSLISMQKGKWDGYFMILIFDIPEKKRTVRNILRKKLVELGFGMLQESVWISPFHIEDDLQEFLQEKGFSEYVFILSVKVLMTKDIKTLVEKIWGLKEIDKSYETIIQFLGDGIKHKRITRKEIKKAWRLYFDALSRDPFLPRELLKDNAREKAARLLQNFTV